MGGYLLTVWVLLTLNFVLPRAMPGDPITAMLASNEAVTVDADTRAELAAYYGMDQPVAVQYVRYLDGLARGDLGVSVRYRMPVTELLAGRLRWTALLVGSGMVVALGVGLAAGVHAGWRRGSRLDRRLLVALLAVRNVPPFALASLAVLVFAVKLGWLPLGGAATPFFTGGVAAGAADVAHHLVLPAGVLAVQFSAGYFLLMRAGMVTQLGADHLLLGRAKGLSDRRLQYRYAARNALLPVVTVTAMHLSFAVTGSLFVETVFAYPGMGRLAFDAVEARDYPVVQGCFVVFSVSVVTLNLVAELLYTRLDPRVRA